VHFFLSSFFPQPNVPIVADWVTVSSEYKIYVADVGLSMEECNYMVAVTEQQCRGQYAAYTYAKQTLGCREFPVLANAVKDAVHTVVSAIVEEGSTASTTPTSQSGGTVPSAVSATASSSSSQLRSSTPQLLALDDREPHMVKYDVTKKERQKLDMHTDKSEWTFLIAISNGAGLDYVGGGTYFECLDATVHVQRGHALIFPGKLRHCGQRITSGVRFLLVGFLVDKTPTITGSATTAATTTNDTNNTSDSQATTPKTAAAILSPTSSSSSTSTTTTAFIARKKSNVNSTTGPNGRKTNTTTMTGSKVIDIDQNVIEIHHELVG
jgi:hypothetical protein